MSGPLDGYRIIDLTTMVSGPLATSTWRPRRDVIKENAGQWRPHAFGWQQTKWHVFELLNINRSKRPVTLNLKDDRGTTALKRSRDRRRGGAEFSTGVRTTRNRLR